MSFNLYEFRQDQVFGERMRRSTMRSLRDLNGIIDIDATQEARAQQERREQANQLLTTMRQHQCELLAQLAKCDTPSAVRWHGRVSGIELESSTAGAELAAVLDEVTAWCSSRKESLQAHRRVEAMRGMINGGAHGLTLRGQDRAEPVRQLELSVEHLGLLASAINALVSEHQTFACLRR